MGPFPAASRPGPCLVLLRDSGNDLLLYAPPLCHQRADDHRLDDPHDLVAVGVVRAELGALVGVEPAFEQGSEDRRVDLRPVERRRLERRVDLVPFQRQGGVVVEKTAVEPRHRLEPDSSSRRHRPEQVAGEVDEFLRSPVRVLQHPGEHVVGQAGRHPRRTCRTPAGSRNAPPSAGRGRVPGATAQAPRRSPQRARSPSGVSRPDAAAPGRTSPISACRGCLRRRGLPARTRASRSRCWSSWCGCGTAPCRRR